jgi:hypothetical protein
MYLSIFFRRIEVAGTLSTLLWINWDWGQGPVHTCSGRQRTSQWTGSSWLWGRTKLTWTIFENRVYLRSPSCWIDFLFVFSTIFFMRRIGWLWDMVTRWGWDGVVRIEKKRWKIIYSNRNVLWICNLSGQNTFGTGLIKHKAQRLQIKCMKKSCVCVGGGRGRKRISVRETQTQTQTQTQTFIT